ncbi:MAG: hypothetical protein HGA66_00790 [Holophaga sp.]|nr:hypothetical protein [Holophaga sp.]
MLPVLLALALTPSAGPALPAVQGLRKPLPVAADVAAFVKWSLAEMGQAVVVVEGEYALPLPRVSTGIQILEGKMRLFSVKMPNPADIPAAPWMDTSTLRSGGNVVQKIYPIGWGY